MITTALWNVLGPILPHTRFVAVVKAAHEGRGVVATPVTEAMAACERLAKLQAENRTAAVLAALRHKLVGLEASAVN